MNVIRQIAFSTYGGDIKFTHHKFEEVQEILDLCIFRADELKTDYSYRIVCKRNYVSLTFKFEAEYDD